MTKTYRFKLVVVGDTGCGKTSLILSFTQGPIPASRHLSISLQEASKFLTIDGKDVSIAFWDTKCGGAYERLRPLSYQLPDTHVALICYSIASSDSCEAVVERWAEELKPYCPKTPLIVVGCKSDLDEHRIYLNSMDQGVLAANLIGAYTYRECSARTGEGVQALLEEVARAGLTTSRKRRRSQNGCVIA